jgi:hypothetical protein
MASDPTTPADSPVRTAAAAVMIDPSWSRVGRWDPMFPLPNVAIHTHVLPDGKVLFWGRRDDPNGSMNEHACTPHVWDPTTGTSTSTPRPTLADGTTVNLFCSGHTFLPDGRLLVAGGHLTDGNGVNQVYLRPRHQHLDSPAHNERGQVVPDRHNACRRQGVGVVG